MPFGAVKEQASGLYAQTMAERGFIAIAHDPSYVGESGGEPHRTASAEAFVEDSVPPSIISAPCHSSIASGSA